MYLPKTKYEMLKEVVRCCRNEMDDIRYLDKDPLPFLRIPNQAKPYILCGSLGISDSVYEIVRQLIDDTPPNMIQLHYFPENDVNGHLIVSVVVTEFSIYYCGGMTDFSGTGGAACEWMLKVSSLLAELSDTGVFVEQIYHNQPLDELWQGEIQ